MREFVFRYRFQNNEGFVVTNNEVTKKTTIEIDGEKKFKYLALIKYKELQYIHSLTNCYTAGKNNGKIKHLKFSMSNRRMYFFVLFFVSGANVSNSLVTGDPAGESAGVGHT